MNDIEIRVKAMDQALASGAHDVIVRANEIFNYIKDGIMPETKPATNQAEATPAAINPVAGMDRAALQHARDWAHPTDTIIGIPAADEPVDQVLHPDGTDPTFVQGDAAVDTKYHTDTADGGLVSDTDKPATGNGAPGAPYTVTEAGPEEPAPLVADPAVDPSEPQRDVSDHG